MTFKALVNSLIGIVNDIAVPLILLFAFAVLVWKIAELFLINGADAQKRAEGRQVAFWGILALVVAFGAWTIVKLLLSTLGIAPNP
jgi:Type IV secretion system pilin